jgi:sugar/nucleoside kinase (ribokinase family)
MCSDATHPNEGMRSEATRDLRLLASLDATWLQVASGEDTLVLLPHADIFCPNFREAEAITGEADPPRAADAPLDAGVNQVGAITLGEEGCYVKPTGGSGERLHVKKRRRWTPPALGTRSSRGC